MAGTIAGLTMTVGKSIAAFNAHDEDGVRGNLAPDIIVHSLHPKTALVGQAGQDNIVGQFKGQPAEGIVGDNPTFTLLHMDIDLHGVPDGQATKATVTGTAKWNDNNGPETLQFTFQCRFENSWIFTEVSAITI